MTPDWSQVTLEYVRRACEMYDSGAAQPKRPAQSTFLLFNGKAYPAKFIRGLAYRLATGVELDPNRDYSGGAETARFFEGLGLATQHDPSPIPAAPAMMAMPALPPAAQAEPLLLAQPSLPVPQRRPEPQKEALAALLRRRFDAIEREAKFPWLTVPALDQMDSTLSAIYLALQGMRGYSKFASFGKSLCCDFFVPAAGLVIEYDEKQHFTVQRAKVLELYPADLRLGFDREEWLTTCCTIQATDPTPPYRDEQRAFYDSLRDILAARNGVRLIRLRYGAIDWASAGAEEQLGTILTSGQPIASQHVAVPVAHAASCPAEPIRKLALVSHDYNVPDSRGLLDYSEDFARINRLCDERGCDTILYALYTWDQDSAVARNHEAIFGSLAHVQRIIIEIGQPALESFDHVEVWLRGQKSPVVAKQRFTVSSASGSQKQEFLDDLDQRRISNALLVLCGESNIASLVRGSDEVYDPYGFADWLRDANVQLILNPIHDYMRRYEMREKRRYYSRGGRTVISVWNKGRGQESYHPWTVFHDGEERTAAVVDIAQPLSDRPDIRIGIVDLPLADSSTASHATPFHA